MAINTDGSVLRPPRSAPSNATSTGEAATGVFRDHHPLPSTYDYYGSVNDLAEVSADQFRAMAIDDPDQATTEYLLWAANSSSLTLIEDPDWTVLAFDPAATGSIPPGTAPVYSTLTATIAYDDGTNRLVILDIGGRAIAEVRQVAIQRGDLGDDPADWIRVGPDAPTNFDSQDADAGVVVLPASIIGNASTPNPLTLDGGVSTARGDTIVLVTYILAAARFWWTRNDADVTRFGWNGKTNRWEPFKGGPVKELPVLSSEGEYSLFPKPSRFAVGDFLPRDTTTDDAYALIRVGIRPDSLAVTPLVEVVPDGDVLVAYPFVGVTPDAVVGQTNGVLQFNPNLGGFIDQYAGQTVWYNPEQFPVDFSGDIGPMLGAGPNPLFLSPVPGPTDRPFIRFGFRRHLSATALDTDNDLNGYSPASGEVAWSKTSGRLKFNQNDLDRADPTNVAEFNIQYLSERVYYDGVSLASRSLRTREPVQLVDSGGSPATVGAGNHLFIPDGRTLQSGSTGVLGLGVSGVLRVPDGTGTLPDATAGTPGTRPNGTGLVRQITGVGDSIIFTSSGAIADLRIEEFEDDLPKLPFTIRKGRAYVAEELVAGDPGSRVALGVKDRSRWGGEAIYFLQSDVQPAVYAEMARLHSRKRGPFIVAGTEKLYFAIDGTLYTWDASTLGPAGSYTATEVATSMDALVTGGRVYQDQDRVIIEAADPDTGSVEIGSGATAALADRDFTGAALLGFVPGWRVDNPSVNECWLPDNGASLGVARSPQNKDRSNDTPDIKARGQFAGTVFAESLPGTPTFTITTPPIQDVAGWDENVFFLVADGLNFRLLDNLVDLKYEFAQQRFLWLKTQFEVQRVEQATAALQFSRTSVVGDTMYPTVNALNGLYVAENGTTWTYQEPGRDFLLPGNGSQGLALLIDRIGDEVGSGGAGSFAAGSVVFTDPNATFLTDGVLAGYRLRILAGDAQGSYIVAADAISETALLVNVDVPFPADAGPSNGAPYAAWRVYEGFSEDVYDPAVVATEQYTQFNHLPREPFQIRLLDGLGPVPAPTAGTYLSAVVTEAYQNGREVAVRFRLIYGSPEAALTPLVRGTEVGVMANGSLFVPDLADTHFTGIAFSLRVGSRRYTLGTDLSVVGALTPNLPGDQIEVLNATGEMNFGATTLDELEGSVVVYDQEFLAPTLLGAGQAEYDPANGEINLSDADMTAYEGLTAYFVERMITENRKDVAVSPLGGAFYFNRPLRAGQLVEAEYYQADSEGNQIGDLIVEFLPIILRLEGASRTSSRVYRVNPTSRTIDGKVDTLIWVDNQLQNYGNTTNVAFQNGILTFNNDLDPAAVVQVNYAVYEAFGGEQAYNTSTIPVWRPPFFLLKAQDTFTLRTDRTGDVVPGMLMRLGATPFYIKEVTYDGGANATSVTVWPAYDYETGGRAPGNDVLTLLTTEPVAPLVNGVPTAAPLGFLLELVGVSYEPVDKGMLSFIFHGNLTQYAVPGHLIEMGGYPFIIVGSELASDGRTTRVDVSSPAPTGFRPGTDAVKISVRPIYPPTPASFLGIYPFVPSEDVELVLYGETDLSGNPTPGRTLTRDVHYKANADDGSIELVAPMQMPLQAGQRLVFRYTKLRTLAPFVEDGAVISPRYKAGYSYGVAPSAENGLLGTTLLAKYTYRNPDSFYFRTVPLVSYMGEVAQIAVGRVQASNPSGGAPISVFGGIDNKKQGRLGLYGERKDLTDQDRAARTFIDSYNVAIVAFEQVAETLNGAVIGDQDGKFRFFVGRGKTYAPPGYEDDITGDLNTRFVWSEVFLGANGVFGVSPLDKVVDPETATRDTQLVVDGDPMDPTLLRWYVDQQKALLSNDMDDLVLAGLDRPNFLGGFPFPKFKMRGLFKRMWEAHRLSRLYPEAALAFTTTFPGIGADLAAGEAGVYAFFKIIVQPKSMRGEDDKAVMTGSTFAKPIGVIANPSLGVIQNITDANPRERLPRARIWAYYPDGSQELDDALGTNTVGVATIVATPLLLKDFPINPATGFPAKTQFLSEGGDLPDLNTGDYELSTPGFQEYDDQGIFKKKIMQQIAVGRPTGQTYTVGNANQTIAKAFASSAGVDISPYFGGVYVGTVQAGCVITLVDNKGKDLTGADVLQVLEGELEGSPITVEQGDTIYAVPPASMDASEMDDPPTAEQMAEFALGIPGYRRGFDLGVQKRGGNFIDLSMPSIKDPNFPVKEMLGQKGPGPLSTIEADLEFVNNDQYPHSFPALLGQPFNDNGDYTIPYRATKNTELDRLGGLTVGFTDLLADGLAPTATQLWLAVYPNEVQGVDGTVIAAWDGLNPPATLRTASDLTPVAAGPYVAHSGDGDVRSYDLLLVEVPNTGGTPAGVTGILTVGDVPTSGHLEVPRFVTATREGGTTPTGYTFDNAMTHVSSTHSSGLLITAVTVGINRVTTLDASTTGAPYFNDGQGGTSGGLNRILAGANNAIVIRLYQNGGGGSPGTLVEEIVITGTEASGGAAGGRPLLSFTASDDTLVVTTVGAVDFVSNLGVRYDYTLTIDTYIDTTTDGLITTLGGTSPGIGNGTGSSSAKVGTDRLTFYERVDLTTAPARGTLNAGAVDISAGLSVYLVTAFGSPSNVNGPGVVNGGVPFTFLPRDGTGDVGFFTPAAFPAEQGHVKVMGWEGDGNISIPLTSLVFSAVPSSEIDEMGVILNGTGTIPDSNYGALSIKTWVDTITANAGSLGRVMPGDILVVSESFAGDGAIKSGTYLIRHAVTEFGSAIGGHEAPLVAQVGTSGQWLNAVLPKITVIDSLNLKVTIDSIGVGPGTNGSLWDETSGMDRLYVVPNTTNPTTIVSMQISSFTAGGEFTLVTGSGQNAAGAGITNNAFFNAIAEGMKVTGMRYLPMGTGWGNGLPSNNVVGWRSSTLTAAGFRDLVLCNPTLTGDASANQAYFSFTAGPPSIVLGATGAASQNLGVIAGTAADSRQFQSDKNTIVYDDVPAFFDLQGIDAAQWDQVHAAGAATTSGVLAALPSDRWVASTTVDTSGGATGTPGFVALAGVFLEPSFPRSVRPLNDPEPHVVYNGVSVPAWNRIAIRNAVSFGGGTSEDVYFEVRRIRRFHNVNSTVTSNLDPLRFAYEIRRGTVLTYAQAGWPLPGYILTADTTAFGTATQLGAFNNPDVSIYPGDEVRLLDANGIVVDTAEVGMVGETLLLLRDPGFAVVTPSPGDSFTVFLRQAPVPQEQNAEQLFDVMVERVLHTTTPNYTAQTGGRVDVFNELKDTTVPDYRALAVVPQEGDYIIIDPAGALQGPSGPANPQEYGSRPYGDQSVPARGPTYPWVAGRPAGLDDNRGFYRVTSVAADGSYLAVDGTSAFSGDGTIDVTYGSPGSEYAVLPTISASGTTVGQGNPNFPREAQQDLRTTALADPGTNSFDVSGVNDTRSVGPFGYRIVRPTTLFSEETIEFAFFLRERMQSWLEELTSSFGGAKSGSYFVFQRDKHIEDLGSPTNPNEGKGVVSNGYIDDLGGLLNVAPFANVSDCLSVLDRRFWGLDFRLDTETPLGSATPYADLANGEGRPVLPDRVDDVLDRDDRLRELRYAWIKFRANTGLGTLPSIRRFDEQLPGRLAEQEELLRLQEGLDET